MDINKVVIRKLSGYIINHKGFEEEIKIDRNGINYRRKPLFGTDEVNNITELSYKAESSEFEDDFKLLIGYVETARRFHTFKDLGTFSFELFYDNKPSMINTFCAEESDYPEIFDIIYSFITLKDKNRNQSNGAKDDIITAPSRDNVCLDKKAIEAKSDLVKRLRKRNYEVPIEELDLTVRTYKKLKSKGINTIKDLKYMNDDQRYDLVDFSNKMFYEIIHRLGELQIL